jgi:hypothetical protein
MLLALLPGGAGHAGAADFLADPPALCRFLAVSGMKAQLEWSQPKPGGPYGCQYSDQFSGRTPIVRGGSASVDPTSGEVSLSLVIQALGDVTHLEAVGAFKPVLAAFYEAQGQSAPDAVLAVVGSKTGEKRRLPNGTVEATSIEMWEEQRVLGLSFTGKASAATLAAVRRGPTAQERAATATVKKALGERCLAAIADSGQAAARASLKESATQLSASRYQFQYADPAGGSFSCQVCDEADPKVNCGVMGAMLSYAPKGGEAKALPAELDRKCVFHLQHELMADDSGVFIDQALVARIRVTPAHTDTRWVYRMDLDGKEYRCVIRKSDSSFTVEQHAGRDWHGLVSGIMF